MIERKLNTSQKSKFEAEQIRAEQNKLGKEIAKADKNEKEELLKKASELSHNFKGLSEKAEEVRRVSKKRRKVQKRSCDGSV